MNSAHWITIFEGVGQLAVIVSVLYLAREVRQNNLIARGESEREIFDSFNEILRGYSDAESVAIAQRALADFGGLSRFEQARFCISYLIPHLNNLDSIWTHHKLGLISDDRYQSTLFVVLSQLQTAGGKQAWNGLRKAYREEFVSMIDRSLEELDHIPPINEVLDWLKADSDS